MIADHLKRPSTEALGIFNNSNGAIEITELDYTIKVVFTRLYIGMTFKIILLSKSSYGSYRNASFSMTLERRSLLDLHGFELVVDLEQVTIKTQLCQRYRSHERWLPGLYQHGASNQSNRAPR